MTVETRNNLRTIQDRFGEMVHSRIPCTLAFDGEEIVLMGVPKGQHALTERDTVIEKTTDLEDDTVYRLVGDDVDSIADEENITLQEGEFESVKKGVEAGLGMGWDEVVESRAG